MKKIDPTVPAMPVPRCIHGHSWKLCDLCPPKNRKEDHATQVL